MILIHKVTKLVKIVVRDLCYAIRPVREVGDHRWCRNLLINGYVKAWVQEHLATKVRHQVRKPSCYVHLVIESSDETLTVLLGILSPLLVFGKRFYDKFGLYLVDFARGFPGFKLFTFV